jgi:hypothetical protein
VKRTSAAVVLASLLVIGACGRQSAGPASGRQPTGPDPTRVEIYIAAFRALAQTERWFDPVLLDDRICPDAGDIGTGGDPAPCEGRFTRAEQEAILAGLSDLPNVRFVDDAERIGDQIVQDELDGELEEELDGVGLLSVGPIEGNGDHVTVGGSSYCGSLCGHWMTLVVERGSEGWTVTGTTGPVAIA